MFPLAIIGLILLLAGSHWFAGALTVGWILLGVGLATTLVPLAIVLGAGGIATLLWWKNN